MKDQLFQGLKAAMLHFDEAAVVKGAADAIRMKINPLETVGVLTEAISEIGARFAQGELFLPELMMAARTMKAAMQPLEQEIRKEGLQRHSEGKVVFGTVFGDLHDIGKNMVTTLLTANGFEVIDLGINVPAERFARAVEENQPQILGMSSLLTTTAVQMENVIATLSRVNLRGKTRIMIGGGSITQEFAQKIGADGYEPNAALAVELARRLALDLAKDKKA
jgi:5-methyltetrahydrofolate--homocysteine methyltransferase